MGSKCTKKRKSEDQDFLDSCSEGNNMANECAVDFMDFPENDNGRRGSFLVDLLPGIPKEGISIDLHVTRDPRKTHVEETNKIVIMHTPQVLATAWIMVPPLKTKQNWEIGWVQAVRFIKFRNSYGKLGFSSWEFPQLNVGKRAVNDSSGAYFPYYGNGPEMVRIKGPFEEAKEFQVTMTDAPKSHITLRVPTLHHTTKKACDLTGVRRKQKFTLWLIARNLDTNDVYPLRTITWDMDVNIKVDPQQQTGRRATLQEPKTQMKPVVLSHILSIPEEALLPPDANRAQMLLWRPSSKREAISVIVAPNTNSIPSTRELLNPSVYRESV